MGDIGYSPLIAMDLMGRGYVCTWVQPGTPKLDTHHFHCADWATPKSPKNREVIRIGNLLLRQELEPVEGHQLLPRRLQFS